MTSMHARLSDLTRTLRYAVACLGLATSLTLIARVAVLADDTPRPIIFLDPLISESEGDAGQGNDTALETSIQIANLLKLEATQFGFSTLLSTDTQTYRSIPQRRAFASNQRALVYVAITSGPSKSGAQDCIHIYSPVTRKEVWVSDKKNGDTHPIVEMMRKQLDQENKMLASILQKTLNGAGVCATTATRRAAVLDLSMIPTVMLSFDASPSRDAAAKQLDGKRLKKASSAVAVGLKEFVPQIRSLKR